MATKGELIEAIAKMSVLELSELVKAIEEKFGVSAAVAVAAAPAAAGAAHAGGAAAAEEKTDFTVVLASAPADGTKTYRTCPGAASGPPGPSGSIGSTRKFPAVQNPAVVSVVRLVLLVERKSSLMRVMTRWASDWLSSLASLVIKA